LTFHRAIKKAGYPAFFIAVCFPANI